MKKLLLMISLVLISIPTVNAEKLVYMCCEESTEGIQCLGRYPTRQKCIDNCSSCAHDTDKTCSQYCHIFNFAPH